MEPNSPFVNARADAKTPPVGGVDARRGDFPESRYLEADRDSEKTVGEALINEDFCLDQRRKPLPRQRLA